MVVFIVHFAIQVVAHGQFRLGDRNEKSDSMLRLSIFVCRLCLCISPVSKWQGLLPLLPVAWSCGLRATGEANPMGEGNGGPATKHPTLLPLDRDLSRMLVARLIKRSIHDG
jgi:hypothetical protein